MQAVLSQRGRLPVLRREFQADEAAVVVRAHGRPPLLVNGPGSVWTFWRWRQVIVVDLKPLALELSVDDLKTKDGAHFAVRVGVEAQVVNPVDAAVNVVDYSRATFLITETALRAVLRQWLSTDLSERMPEVEAELLDEVKSAGSSWGVAVSAVRIQLDE